MTERLHDLLDRMAREAPAVHVEPDLFQRAQRARRRERLLVPGLVVTVMLLVLGSSLWGAGLVGPDGGRQDGVGPVSGDREPAMPSRVYDVPDHVPDEFETDLALGPVAVAFWDQGFDPVLVSALDGSYHRVHLPGHDDEAPGFPNGGLAVSPDGRQLAYSWHAPLPERSGPHVPSGVAVLDLETGAVERFRSPGGKGVGIDAIGWSPDGRYLVYWLNEYRTWDTGRSRSTEFRFERLSVRDGRTVIVPLSDAQGAAGVANDGRVAAAGSGLPGWWDAHSTPAVRRLDDGGLRGRFGTSNLWTAAWSPDGERLAFGAGSLGRNRPVLVDPGRGTARELGSLPVGVNQMLGWLDTARVAVLHAPPHAPRSSVRVVNVDSGAVAEAVEVDGHSGNGYSFATDLLRDPTRDFPAPDWPTDWAGLAGTTLPWTGLGVVVLVGLLWLRDLRGAQQRRQIGGGLR